MSRILLKFQGTQSMVQIPSASIVTLTDEFETRQMSIVCDNYTKYQLDLRTHSESISMKGGKIHGVNPSDITNRMLPEVLFSIINYLTELQPIVVITGVSDGQYNAVIEDATTGTTFPLRVSDAIVFAVANKFVPIYVEDYLWNAQSVPYCKNSAGVSIPINSLSREMLYASLNQAIENEQYEMAQQLKEELERRKKV